MLFKAIVALDCVIFLLYRARTLKLTNQVIRAIINKLRNQQSINVNMTRVSQTPWSVYINEMQQLFSHSSSRIASYTRLSVINVCKFKKLIKILLNDKNWILSSQLTSAQMFGIQKFLRFYIFTKATFDKGNKKEINITVVVH